MSPPRHVDCVEDTWPRFYFIAEGAPYCFFRSVFELVTCTLFLLVVSTHPSRPLYSNLLAMGAMGVWGVGTSRVIQERLGLTESSAAVILALGSIFIPILDSEMSNPFFEQFYDKVRMQGMDGEEGDYFVVCFPFVVPLARKISSYYLMIVENMRLRVGHASCFLGWREVSCMHD